MSLAEKLSGTDSLLVKRNYQIENYYQIPVDLLKSGARSYVLIDDDRQRERVINLSRREHPKIKFSSHPEEEIIGDESIIYMDYSSLFQVLTDLISNKIQKIDLFQVLIINDVHQKGIKNLVLVNLWKKIFLSTEIRPYLLMTTISEKIMSLPFYPKIIDETENKNLTVYHDRDLPVDSDTIIKEMYSTVVEMNSRNPISEEMSSTWLIFFPTHKGASVLSTKLYKNLGKNSSVYHLREGRNYDRLNRRGRRCFLIVSTEKFLETLYKQIDGVFDPMVCCENDSNVLVMGNKYLSDIREGYLESGFVFRFCTEDSYSKLPEDSETVFTDDEMEKLSLKLFFSGIDPEDLLEDQCYNLSEAVKKLEVLGCIFNREITETGKLAYKLPLNCVNSVCLSNWIEKEYPVFPGLVVLALSENSSPLKGSKFPFSLEDQLDTFLEVLKKYQNLEMHYMKVSRELKINEQVLRETVGKIKGSIPHLKINKLGLFNTKNTLRALQEVYDRHYSYNKFHLTDKNNMTYRSGDNYFRLDLGEKKLPEKVYVLRKEKNNLHQYKSMQKVRCDIKYYFTVGNHN